MIEHDGCEMCKYFNCNEVDSNSPCYDCVSAHKRRMLEDKFEPMTNGDKIRKMNDEELAQMILDWQFEPCNSCEYKGMSGKKFNCKLGVIGWLQKEVE